MDDTNLNQNNDSDGRMTRPPQVEIQCLLRHRTVLLHISDPQYTWDHGRQDDDAAETTANVNSLSLTNVPMSNRESFRVVITDVGDVILVPSP